MIFQTLILMLYKKAFHTEIIYSSVLVNVKYNSVLVRNGFLGSALPSIQ